MIAIVGAMEEEVAALKPYIENQTTTTLFDKPVVIGTIAAKDVILLQGGIGKVNTAICVTLLFEKYPNIEYLINIGSAGGLNLDQNVGDVIIGSQVIHHDVDVRAFNYPLGQVPQSPLAFEADRELVEKTKQVLADENIQAKVGLIVSGDQFIFEQNQVDHIQNHFAAALCAEMEAATIGHVCHNFNKKFIITRSLSDVFNKGNSSIQFDEYLALASQASAKMCVKLIQRI